MISHPFRRIKHFIREKELLREPKADYSTGGGTPFSQQSSNVGQGQSGTTGSPDGESSPPFRMIAFTRRVCRRGNGGPSAVVLGSSGPTGRRGRGSQLEFNLLGDA